MTVHAPAPTPFTPDLATILCLVLVFSFLPISQILAARLLPKSTSRSLYYLFLWCSFDVLTHTIVEGSYLYHCFFSYIESPVVTSDHPHPASLGRSSSSLLPGPFLNRSGRLYGSFYSTGPMARLWQEYAKADRRWGGADTTVIALELLTVLGAGPLAFYICTLIKRITNSNDLSYRAGLEAKMWFTAVVLSTAELYGGFITFAPEWLSGSALLVTDDPVYLWLYLVFFNTLWVFIPFWILWMAWNELGQGFVRNVERQTVKKRN